MLLDEKIVALERAFEAAAIPHAFGGANALAYYAAPRATHDIDLNVFVGADRAGEVLRLLGALGVSTQVPHLIDRIEREGQARVFWDKTPIDLFFSYDPLHESCMQRRRSLPFGDDRIHVLSGEDLVLYKVIFDRAKDWRDLAELVYAANEPLDFDYVRRWLGRILEPDDPRHPRLERLVASNGRDLG